MTGLRLSADWLVPVEGEPVARGAVLIDGGGRIAAAGPADVVPAPHGTPSEHFDGCALLPGLVNAHTHLELTGFGGAVRETGFPAWIQRLRELKETRTRADWIAAARQGLADCHAAGVTTVADTGDSGAVIEALAETGGSGIAYAEVFGPDPAQVAESMAGLKVRIDHQRRFTSARVRLGVSPHAPYSVSGPLYAAVSRWARERRLPIAVHLAESMEETALLRDGAGAFADMWARRGIPLPVPPGTSPVEWLRQHGVLGADTLCIHVVQAGADDVARLAKAECGIAHCPSSNGVHGHGAAPVRALLDAGLRVGCGTDSVVSVGALDLLAEVRAARLLAGLDAAAALRLCTIDAARAIGLDGEVGSLVAGKWGDAAVVDIRARNGQPGREGIVDAVVATRLEDVRGTWLGGRQVYRSPLAAAAAVSLA